MEEIATKIFNEDENVIVVQIQKLDDGLRVKKSTLESMQTDKIMDNARVFIRSIHCR